MRWKFLLPTTARLAASLPPRRSLKVWGERFYFRSSRSVREVTRPLVSRVDPSLLEHWDSWSSYISVSADGTDWRGAWESLEPAFDTLRGIIEISDLWGSISLRTQPGQIATVPHPTAIFVFPNRGPPDGSAFYRSPPTGHVPAAISDEAWNVLRSAWKFMREAPDPDSTNELIGDALRLYAHAADEHDRADRFLGFWQMAECLNARVHGESKKLAGWISEYGGTIQMWRTGPFGEALARSALPPPERDPEHLATLRDTLVHRGISRVTERDANDLKLRCESALDNLISLRTDLPTKAHLREYYRQRTVCTTDLRRRRRALDFILSDRSRTT